MRIACDVCKTTAAAVICCADEAALCAKCDVEVHAANKLAGKHRRLPLDSDSSKLPRCDICQDKAAFIFCVEDRALFCEDCDEAIHLAGTLSANHQRLLATGIRVGLTSIQNTGSSKHQSEPPNGHSMAQTCKKNASKKQTLSVSSSSAWPVDDFLQLPDYESGYKKEPSVEYGELPWFADISFSPEGASGGSLTLAEVPEMLFKQPSNESFYKLPKTSLPYKNPRIGMLDDDDFFTVPDLG